MMKIFIVLILLCSVVFAEGERVPSQRNPLPLIVRVNTANLRQLPSADAEIAGKSLQGEVLSATRKEGQWYAVRNRNGVQSWIHETLVTIAEENKVEGTAQNPVVKTNEHIVPIVPVVPATVNNIPQAEAEIEVVEVQDTVPAPAPKVVFAYNRKGRDPFLPLDRTSFIREGLPNINDLTLVGILYDPQDGLALFEERRNNEIIAFSMKIGDPVVSGKLLRIESNKVVFLLREATFSYTVEMELNFN